MGGELLAAVDPTDVYNCESCGGDYHADWLCPVCGHDNECRYWEPEGQENRCDVTDVCERCGIEYRIGGKYPD